MHRRKTTGQNKAAKGTNNSDAAEYSTRYKATLNRQTVSNHSYPLQHIVSTVSECENYMGQGSKAKGNLWCALKHTQFITKN